ncbi:MAG: ribonuclease E/G, partial [Clostridia bacterium]|nr:ribonuclease E/G [Clostridia bacterium]
IDFIDMPTAAQGEELTRQLKLFLKRDRARCCVYGLTRLGLMEMSRKKKNEELGRLTGPKSK